MPNLKIFVSFDFDKDGDIKNNFVEQAKDNSPHRVRNSSLNEAYWQSRGYEERPDDWENDLDDNDGGDDGNRANQLNPDSDTYWSGRGETRPN